MPDTYPCQPPDREGARPHGPAAEWTSASPSPESNRTDRLAAALAKAKARDATDPERHEPRVMNDELARELARILVLSDPAVAAEVCRGVAEARELFLAEEGAPLRLPPPSATV